METILNYDKELSNSVLIIKDEDIDFQATVNISKEGLAETGNVISVLAKYPDALMPFIIESFLQSRESEFVVTITEALVSGSYDTVYPVDLFLNDDELDAAQEEFVVEMFRPWLTQLITCEKLSAEDFKAHSNTNIKIPEYMFLDGSYQTIVLTCSDESTIAIIFEYNKDELSWIGAQFIEKNGDLSELTIIGEFDIRLMDLNERVKELSSYQVERLALSIATEEARASF